MTPARMNEIARAVQAACPGPWVARPWGPGGTAASVRYGPMKLEAFSVCGSGLTSKEDDANAAFVALCRQAVPELLEYVAALEAVVRNDVAADSPAARALYLLGMRHAEELLRRPGAVGEAMPIRLAYADLIGRAAEREGG